MPGLRISIAVLSLLLTVRTASAEDGLTQAAQVADEAMAHGHGTTCDLSAKPVASGGYYPCLDIPPYRFVRAYSNGSWRLDGYLVADGEPFRFMTFDGRYSTVLVKGPWESDLPPRATKFADDTSGLSAERSRLAEPEGRRIDAERRLREFIENSKK
ncbi:hypothetical protein ACVIGB_000973 [Bradyrhizobium sp. USDA 4341]